MSEVFSYMWSESSPKAFINLRTYIMGITGNDEIFPGGVFYRGVSDEKL